MKFNYQARDKKGTVQSGIIEASSRETAAVLLQKHGLYVTILEQIDRVSFYSKHIKIFEGISLKDIVLFSRQLAIMFKSKVPLVESLLALSKETKNPELKEKILDLSGQVEAGASFSKALSRYPKTFSPFYISMVKSGEIAGSLSESLSYLSDHLEREYHLTSKVKGAMLYPFLVFFVVLLVLGLMVFFVVPNLANVLEETNQPLPIMTKIVIGTSAFLRTWLWLFGLGIVVFISVGFRYYRTKHGKKFFNKIFLKMPLIGPFLKMLYLSRFAENLSTLISGGLPIAEALNSTAEIIDNSSYKEAILKTRDEVRKGKSISSILSNYPEIFPPVFTRMALVGEKTGTLDISLMNIVEFYKKEIERTIDNFLSVLEPLMIIILGIIVAGVVLSVLTPLYQMMSL
ncbi:type II secretion system F family protein [Candidatus Parcubacteria bacterium]|nr:type II secretion system F family protein [Candidatus Parcubacteria bacterium]